MYIIFSNISCVASVFPEQRIRLTMFGIVTLNVLMMCFLYGNSIQLLDDPTYDRLIEATESGETVPFSRTSEIERRVYDLQRTNMFFYEETINILSGRNEKHLLALINGKKLLYPRKDEKDDIIKFYYHTYKGEGARKLHRRILESYAGISRNYIQAYLNRDPEHCKTNPIFKNKTPAQPVVSHTVNSHHQIDLVSFEKSPQVVNGKLYMYVLSVIDIFSRYLFLRPTTSKRPTEIKQLLLEIYR